VREEQDIVHTADRKASTQWQKKEERKGVKGQGEPSAPQAIKALDEKKTACFRPRERARDPYTVQPPSAGSIEAIQRLKHIPATENGQYVLLLDPLTLTGKGEDDWTVILRREGETPSAVREVMQMVEQGGLRAKRESKKRSSIYYQWERWEEYAWQGGQVSDTVLQGAALTHDYSYEGTVKRPHSIEQAWPQEIGCLAEYLGDMFGLFLSHAIVNIYDTPPLGQKQHKLIGWHRDNNRVFGLTTTIRHDRRFTISGRAVSVSLALKGDRSLCLHSGRGRLSVRLRPGDIHIMGGNPSHAVEAITGAQDTCYTITFRGPPVLSSQALAPAKKKESGAVSGDREEQTLEQTRESPGERRSELASRQGGGGTPDNGEKLREEQQFSNASLPDHQTEQQHPLQHNARSGPEEALAPGKSAGAQEGTSTQGQWQWATHEISHNVQDTSQSQRCKDRGQGEKAAACTEGTQEVDQPQDNSDTSDWDDTKTAQLDAAVAEILEEMQEEERRKREGSNRSSLSADARAGEEGGSRGSSLSADSRGEEEREGKEREEKNKASHGAANQNEKREITTDAAKAEDQKTVGDTGGRGGKGSGRAKVGAGSQARGGKDKKDNTGASHLERSSPVGAVGASVDIQQGPLSRQGLGNPAVSAVTSAPEAGAAARLKLNSLTRP
jgi:hypothetical protein